jgi:hypothetical protein
MTGRRGVAHAGVLKAAGLVVVAEGTRRLYPVGTRGIEVLRGWLDGFWDEALAAFKKAAPRKQLKKGNHDDRADEVRRH